MELICKLCNGMTEVGKKCHLCGSKMEDSGKLSDYYDPYSPYESRDSMLGADMPDMESGKCVHLLVCPVCGSDTRVSNDLVVM